MEKKWWKWCGLAMDVILGAEGWGEGGGANAVVMPVLKLLSRVKGESDLIDI